MTIAPPRPLTPLCALLALLVLAAGCTHVVPEPESAYSDLPTQTYPFDTVWQCTLEAVRDEGFEIDASEREGNSGRFTTRFKITKKDAIAGSAESQRVSVLVSESGKDAYQVRVAASVFSRRTRHDEWSYQGKDDALVKAIERSLNQSITEHYQGG